MSVKALRNVLFITADQWLGGLVAAHGAQYLFTPNLDRLVTESLSFRRHYGQTCPCGPARASLLTGMYAHNHRSILNGTPLDARHTKVNSTTHCSFLPPITVKCSGIIGSLAKGVTSIKAITSP